MHNDSENTELAALKAELEEAISVTEAALKDLQPAPAPAPPPKTSPAQPTEAKWSKENHPAFQPGYKRPGAPPSPAEEVQAPVTFKVNDMVMARWLSGDKSFYTARITSITGSSADPVYSVTFKSYGNSETLKKHDIKPISNDSKKRKADASPAVATSSPTPTNNPGVISAAANINPDLATQARKEPSKVSDGPARPDKVPRKVKANKELEAGKSKWQDFTNKSKVGKSVKKDSMFRTGEGVNARGKLVMHCYYL